MAPKTFLDSISSPEPCSKEWDEMIGDDEKRFCSGCEKNVYNLSALSRNRARKLVAKNAGQVCVRYVRLPNGRIETSAARLHQIVRPVSIAAGVLSAAVTLTTTPNAQVVGPKSEPLVASDQKVRKKSTASSRVEFLVQDTNDATVESAEVSLTRKGSETPFTATTDERGIAIFPSLPKGRYTYWVSARHFQRTTNSILVTLPVEPAIRVSLEVGTFIGVIAVDPYEVPLFAYIARGENAIVRKFFADGFDLDTKSYHGYTALHVAVEHGNLEVVRLLLDKGADVNQKLKDGRTPLLMLGDCLEPDEDDEAQVLEIMRLLISRGAKVNVQDRDGVSILMIAAENDNVGAVRLLLEAGANPHLKDADGETALDKTDSEEIKKLLTSNQHRAKRPS